MSVTFPLPRSIRRIDYVAVADQAVFGPTPWLAFDAADIVVRTRLGAVGPWTTVTTGFAVALSAVPAGFVTVTFALGLAAGTQVRVESRRVHPRTTDVTRAGSLQTAALERELDTQASVLQELRRDVDAAGDIENATLRAEGAADRAEAALDDVLEGSVPNDGVTDPKVAKPANPAALIDGDKIRYDDNIDPFYMPLVTRSRNWMWITDTDQITGNGTSNDQAGVERAVEKACVNGRKLLIPDDIVIRLTEPVVNVGGRSLRIKGAGVEPYTNNHYGANGLNTRGPGSWFFLDHSGIGFQFSARADAGSLVGGTYVSLDGIGTFRPQPAPAPGWAPAAHDYDFDFTQCSADIPDLMLLNATQGLRWKQARTGQLNIGKIRGQPLFNGINIVNAYDVVRIRDMHFWRYWSLDDDVSAYMLANASAIFSQRNDNPILNNLFAYGYQRLLLVGHFVGDGGDNPGGTTYHASIDNLCSDFGESAIVVAPEANGFTASIAQMYAEQSTSVTAAAAGVAVLGTSAKVHFGTFVNNNSNGAALSVSGANSEVIVARGQPGVFNRSGSGFEAFQAAAAGAVIRIGDLIDLGSGGGAAVLGESAGGRVTGLRRSGVSSVPNGNSGVAVAHGLGVEPRGVNFTLLGAGAQAVGANLPRVAAKDASTFTVDLGVSVGADRPFSWEAFF